MNQAVEFVLIAMFGASVLNRLGWNWEISGNFPWKSQCVGWLLKI
jgi:hypothetical protein